MNNGPSVSYSFSACRSALNASYYYPNAPSTVTSLGGVCPHYRQKTYCPCVSTMATDTCSNIACYQPSNIATQVCSPFPASEIGYCYCQNKLSSLVTSGSIRLSDFQSLISSTAPGSCRWVNITSHPVNILSRTHPVNIRSLALSITHTHTHTLTLSISSTHSVNILSHPVNIRPHTPCQRPLIKLSTYSCHPIHTPSHHIL